MQIVKLKMGELSPNTGQVPGLPINPRQWTKGDVDKLAKSLKETPELFEARPLLVYPYEGKYVILGGNLRYEGARQNKEKEVPCIIFPEETPIEKLKEVVIKDNGSFGAWDYDELANGWDDLPLSDWGVPAWDAKRIEDEIKEMKKDDERLGRIPFTEVLGEEHNYICLVFDNTVDWLQAQTIFGLEPVKALPTKRGGEQSLEFQKRIGIGRVLNGAKAIEMIKAEKENQK